MNRRLLTHLLIFALSMAATTCAWAEPPPTSAPSEQTREAEPLVTRLYNLEYLTSTLPDFPLPDKDAQSTADMPDNGNFSSEPVTIDTIRALITQAVSPDSWHENGGVEGTMMQFYGSLMIIQTPANHEKIRKLLDDLTAEEDRNGVFTIRAWWLNLSPEELAQLYRDHTQQGTTLVPDNLLDSAHLYCQAQTGCYCGQTAHVVTSQSANYIASLAPIVGVNATAYQPTHAEANSGVRLEVTPELAPGGNRVMLRIQSIISECNPIDAKPPPATAEAGAADRMTRRSQEFRTTARLPLSKNVLVGGMTLAPAANNQPARQLYLVFNVDGQK